MKFAPIFDGYAENHLLRGPDGIVQQKKRGCEMFTDGLPLATKDGKGADNDINVHLIIILFNVIKSTLMQYCKT